MERFNALGRGSQMMLVSSVLLFIVSFLRWQEVEFDLGPLGGGSAGVSAWDDFLGILMGILTIVLIARIVAQLAAVNLPIPVSFAMTSAVLAFLIFAFALIKNLTDDYSTFWSYIGVGLAFLIAAGAWLEIQAAGGIDSLKSEATSFGSGSSAAGGTGAATTDAGPAEPAAPSMGMASDTASEAAAPAQDAAPEAMMDTASDAASEAASDLTDEPSTGQGA